MDIEHPKKILRIENACLAENFLDREESEKVGDVDVCSYEDELPVLVEKLCLPPDIYIGSTLIRSPYDKEIYWDIEDYEEKVTRAKAAMILQIAQLLGAKEYEYSSSLKSIQERSSEFNADGTYKVVSVSLEIKNQEKEAIAGKYSDKNIFPNAPERPSQEDHQDALKLAKQTGLYGEPDINSLLKLCDPSKKNRLGTRIVEISASTESTKALDMAFGLNVMPDIFKLNAGFKRSTQYIKSIQMTFTFKFPY